MKIFMTRVGTIILSLTVLLWALSSWPAPPAGAVGPAIDYSLAGRIGHALEHVFAPVGFNWQICIALIPGLAAREVAVASLATALSLLAWYVFAPQCLSTLAVIRRETNSWKTVGIAAGYLFALAYLAAFVTYRVAMWFS
jgi:ferrous iron transport protein B